MVLNDTDNPLKGIDMNKITGLPRIAVSIFVSTCAATTAGLVIKNNLPDYQSRSTKAQTVIGGAVIGGAVGMAASNYVLKEMDDFVDSYNDLMDEVQKIRNNR